MNAVFIFLLSASSCNFLRISPGVVAQGLGGCSVMVEEGLSAFHNPSLIMSTKFNFSLARWLYGTNFCTSGASFRGNAIGVAYLSYGTIQGYDDAGLPTHQFSPYCLTVAAGRKLGPLGVILKNFQERIDSVLIFGFCGGIASYIDLGRIAVGAKIDNIGVDLAQQSQVPYIAAAGLKIVPSDDTELILESRVPGLELNTGLKYVYENYGLVLGAKYLKNSEFSIDDMIFSGGLIMLFQTYEIAYSFGYSEFSTSHNFSIIFTP